MVDHLCYRAGGKFAPEKPKTSDELEKLKGANQIATTTGSTGTDTSQETYVKGTINDLSSTLWSELL